MKNPYLYLKSRTQKGVLISAVLLMGVVSVLVLSFYSDIFSNLTDSKSSVQDVPAISNKEDILNDYANRISTDFKVPLGLKSRVAFWFDIYSRYDSNHRIIHHSLYPWIIFKVVDVTPIVDAELPKLRWQRNQKAEDIVKNEVKNFKKALLLLSQGRTSSDRPELSEYETLIKKALNRLPGEGVEKIKVALRNIRTQTGQKNFFEEGLKKSPLYLPAMEEIFKRKKVPTELTRIPFVESSFNHQAISKVGAAGMWQFMDYTGRSFMIVDKHIDERTSPFKAAEAAANLLKENHMILFKSWPLAVTAWNHGPPGIRRATKETQSTELADIIASYKSRNFDFASSNFYSEFLAALYTEKYKENIFKDLKTEKPLLIHSARLSRSINAKELLKVSGLSKDQFIMFNPDLRIALESDIHIPSGFRLMLNESAKLVLKNLVTQDGTNKRGRFGRNEAAIHNSPAAYSSF